MSGVRFLLDTNFVLGMLKASPAVMGVLGASPPLASECGYSAVTRMELLGFQGASHPSQRHQGGRAWRRTGR